MGSCPACRGGIIVDERCRLVHHLAPERFEIPMNVLDFGASTEIFGGQAGPI